MSKDNEEIFTANSNLKPTLKRRGDETEASPSFIVKRAHLRPSTALEENESVNKIPSLVDLPNEILEKIFDQVLFVDLFNLERVSKTMKNIVLNVAWPRKHTLNHESIIRFINYPKIEDNKSEREKARQSITFKFVKEVLSRANILHLDLSVYHSTTTKNICYFLFKAHQLLSLNLSLIKLGYDSLKNIAHSCHLLEELSLQGCIGNCTYLGHREEALASIFVECPKLKYLNLAMNEINGECFNSIPIQFKLKYLNIAECSELKSHSLDVLAGRVTNIETLILGDVSNTIINLNAWLKNFTKLRFLEIGGESIIALDFSNMKKLEMLNLGSNNFVNDLTLTSLKHCPNLKSIRLNVNGSEDTAFVFEALKTCKNLKYCHFNCDKAIPQLADFVQHSKLQYLGIGNWEDDSDCESIIRRLLTECDSLTHLEFNFKCEHSAILESILKEEIPPKRRNDILKLAVKQWRIEEGNFKFPQACNWVEYIPLEYSESPFYYFTDIRNEYHKEKATV